MQPIRPKTRKSYAGKKAREAVPKSQTYQPLSTKKNSYGCMTEDERETIIRLISEKKDLPTRFRNLLFPLTGDVELHWPGKTRSVCDAVLPFQTTEHISPQNSQPPLKKNKSQDLWSNKLIWGDNKLVMSSMKGGPLRKQIDKQGGIKLIYIDPPFDVGADFRINIEIGDTTLTKEPSVIEEVAYRDTWGRNADSFLSMMHERLLLMRSLLADDGSIFVHCDWRVNSMIRLLLDEVFNKDMFKNEIVWKYSGGRIGKRFFGRKHDTIYWYSKTSDWYFDADQVRDAYAPATTARFSSTVKNMRGGKDFGEQNLNPEGKHPEDVFSISIVAPSANVRTGYPTQKPEELLARLIKACTKKNDIVADFFCGSGTTAVAAERLQRKWVCCDIGRFAIHTTRKRIIELQREVDNSQRLPPSFEVLNLGRYEREYYVGIDPSLSREEQRRIGKEKEEQYIQLILQAYLAERNHRLDPFHGIKNGTAIFVGAIDSPVTTEQMRLILASCEKFNVKSVDVLGFEYEMGLVEVFQFEAKKARVNIKLRHIPNDVFDKRAVVNNQVKFYDAAYIKASVNQNGRKVSISLDNFGVFYSQDNIARVSESLKTGSSRVVIKSGRLLKVTRSSPESVKTETLTKRWSDWIDYWAVDFCYTSAFGPAFRKSDTVTDVEDALTGSAFDTHWVSFRTKQTRTLTLKSKTFEYSTDGEVKIAIKVIDVFGNDTTKILEVKL